MTKSTLNRLKKFVSTYDFWILMAIVGVLCLLVKLKEEGIIFKN